MKPKEIVRKLERELILLKGRQQYYTLLFNDRVEPDWLKELDEEIKTKWRLLKIAKFKTKESKKLEIL